MSADQANAAMLKRDEPAAAPAVAADEDPLAAVRDALDDLIEFASEDAINAGQALPGGRGCREPDVSGMQRRIDEVLAEVRKLMRPAVCDSAQVDACGKSDNGLLTTHNPDEHGVMWGAS